MSEQFNFDIKLIFAILNGKVSAAINRKLYRNFRQYNVDITPEQWTVLLYLWEKDGVTQQELCNATFKDKPSMTRLIDNMERLNLVVRISGKTDRRINLIHLTKTGRDLEEKSRFIANKTLKEGGLIDTPMTWDNYASVIDEVLTMNEKTLAAARKKMVRTVWEQEPSFKDSQLDIALYLSATKTNHDLEAALRLMQSYDPSMFSAMLDLSTASAKQTVHDELKYQAENSQDIADVRALKNSLAQIQYFVSSVNQYTNGVATAADGAHSAKDGSAQLAAGTKTLYDGVNTLNTGAGQLNDGAGQLNDGLNQFNEEGISKLTGALDQDQLHGLKTVLDEMTDRLESYTSFAGAPEDAESSVKFVYKTAETVAAADNVVAETETVKEGNIFTRLWQRIVNLFKF